MRIQPSTIAANAFLSAGSVVGAQSPARIALRRSADPDEAQRAASQAAAPVDSLSISEQAVAKLAEIETGETESPDATSTTEGKSAKDAQAVAKLSEEEQQVVNELKTTDRKVRAHEQAHLAAAGPYAQGGPSYTFEKGPDGRNYAVGGEVNIDTSPIPGDPEATQQKARTIRTAALAAADPSAQDRAVAAQATRMETQARIESQEQLQSGETDVKGDVTTAIASAVAASSQSAAGLVAELAKTANSGSFTELKDESSDRRLLDDAFSELLSLGQSFDAVA